MKQNSPICKFQHRDEWHHCWDRCSDLFPFDDLPYHHSTPRVWTYTFPIRMHTCGVWPVWKQSVPRGGPLQQLCTSGFSAATTNRLPAKIWSSTFGNSFASGCSGTCKTTMWNAGIVFHCPERLNRTSRFDDLHPQNSRRCNIWICNDNFCAKRVCHRSVDIQSDTQNATKDPKPFATTH